MWKQTLRNDIIICIINGHLKENIKKWEKTINIIVYRNDYGIMFI